MTELTARQLQVVVVVVTAGSTKLAAHQLGVSSRTVEATLERARDRTGVQTTAQLVRVLAQRGAL